MKGADRQTPRPKWTASCFQAFRGSPSFCLGLLPAVPVIAVLIAPASLSAGTAEDFAAAGQLKEAGACAEALPLYSAITEDKTASASLRASARYNQAVCLELLGRYPEAITQYSAIADMSGNRVLQRDALFRVAVLDSLNGRYPRARRRFCKLLRRSRDPGDRARLYVQLGALEIETGHRHRAAFQLKRAQRQVTREPDSLEPWFLAQLQVAMGDLFVAEAARLSIGARPPRRVVRRLMRRGALLQRAQQHYVAAIELHQPTWMQAATLKLGRALLAMALEMNTLEQRLADDPGTTKDRDSNHLAAWIGNARPPMSRKAHESFQLCLDVAAESGENTRFGPNCRAALQNFPTELLIGPDTAP